MTDNHHATVFRRINAPGAEAENEPLALFDFYESHSIDPLDTLTLTKAGGAFIQAGAFIRQNTVSM